jgi:apolipoprotein N-acyltransferase
MKKVFLCTFSAFLIFLSFPDMSFWFFAWAAMVPLLYALEGERPAVALGLGLLTGFLSFCGILYWIVPTFSASGEPLVVGLTALCLLALYLSIYFGVFCLVYSLTSGKGHPFFYAFVWVALELVRTRLFTGFPWALLGYTQWNNLLVIQISEFTGVYGVSFLIVAANLAIFGLLRGNKFLSAHSAPVFAVLAVCLIFGIYVPCARCVPCAIRKVAVLQGNVEQYKKWDSNYGQDILDSYGTLAASFGKRSRPDLVVWPETSVPGFLSTDPGLYMRVSEIVRRTGTEHLIGSVDYRGGEIYNSALLLSCTGGITAVYSKVHLVPFGEYMPLRAVFGKFIRSVNEIGETTAGSSYDAVRSSAGLLDVNICFEAIFPDEARRAVKRGAEVIINLTNDAWYLKTSAAAQHFSFNVFRAVENRRAVVRAANTGISGFIDAYGRVVSRTGIFERAAIAGNVVFMTGTTFYTSHGDVFAWCSVILSLLFLTIYKKVI